MTNQNLAQKGRNSFKSTLGEFNQPGNKFPMLNFFLLISQNLSIFLAQRPYFCFIFSRQTNILFYLMKIIFKNLVTPLFFLSSRPTLQICFGKDPRTKLSNKCCLRSNSYTVFQNSLILMLNASSGLYLINIHNHQYFI